MSGRCPTTDTAPSGLASSESTLAQDAHVEKEHVAGRVDSESSLGDDTQSKDIEKDRPELPQTRSQARFQLPPERPQLANRTTTMNTKTISLPPLKRKETRLMQKEAHPWEHLGITLGLPAIVLFDIVVPCIIYYTWYNSHKNEEQAYNSSILGSAIASFGVGELWILLARCWRLFFRRDECAPLLSRSKWEFDATSWVYLVAMVLALIPFVVGSSLELPHLYLYSPSFLMGFLGVLMIITTCLPFKIPIGINSHARGTGLRPFIYYAAEDFIAVDGLQDREFRVRYNERYEQNKAFRRMFLYLTLWWILGVCVYVGCVSAVIWTCEFHIAFGLSLGVLFAYIAVWAGTTALYVKWEIAKEHKAYENGDLEDFVAARGVEPAVRG